MNPLLLLLLILGLSKNQARLKQSGAAGEKNESAFTICLTPEGTLARGSQAKGSSPFAVSIPVSCPEKCEPIGIWHSHPGGDTEPSQSDITEALRLKIKHLCITADGVTKCHEIHKGM
jgi:hypothetical protein